MPFVDHNDVIEAFPPDRADDALGEGILPGRIFFFFKKKKKKKKKKKSKTSP